MPGKKVSGPKSSDSASRKEADRVVTRLRALLAEGASIRQAAAKLRRPHSTVHDLAVRHRLQRRPASRMTKRQQAAVDKRLAAGETNYARIARDVGVHRWTVARHAKARHGRGVLDRLRELLARGHSFRSAAKILRRPRSTLHSLAVRHGLDHRGPTQLTPEKSGTLKRLLNEATLSPSQIARRLQVHKSTVTRAFARKLDEELPEATFRPRRVLGHRCPVHGVVKYWPCVACAATQKRPTAS